MSVTNVRCIGEFQKEGSGDNITYFVAVEGRCLSEMSLLFFFFFLSVHQTDHIHQ